MRWRFLGIVPIGSHAKRAARDPNHVVAPWLAMWRALLQCRVNVDLWSHCLISLPNPDAAGAPEAPCAQDQAADGRVAFLEKPPRSRARGVAVAAQTYGEPHKQDAIEDCIAADDVKQCQGADAGLG